MPEVKFGRRPPKRKRSLQLAPSLTGILPAHPVEEDYLAVLSSWKMLGNDHYGDCVAVTWANLRRLTTHALTTESYPTIGAVIDLYKTQNPMFPSQDDGMDIQTCLEHLVSVGGPDGVKALAFASVNPRDLGEMAAAVAIFGGIWVGIDVLDVNMDEFDAGNPWDYVEASGVAGGHSVLVGGYGAPKDPRAGDFKFITWAAETSFTDNFIAHQFDEAWVVIWPEHLLSRAFLEGIDLAMLAADYETLTGRPFPVVPSPGPPHASDADTTLANATRVWACARHSGANRLAANAVNAWLKEKSL